MTLNIAFLFVVLALFPAYASSDEVTFSNAAAGFTFSKPASWVCLSMMKLEKSREDIRLGDAQLEQQIRQNALAPLVIVTRHPEPYDELNPTIQIVIRPLGPMTGKSALEILQFSVSQLMKTFPDFTYVQDVHETSVSDLPAAALRATYTVKNSDGRSSPVLTRMYVVPRGSMMFLIGMTDPRSGPEISEDEFSEALDSIQIEH